MKTLKHLFLLSLCATFVLSSCKKDDDDDDSCTDGSSNFPILNVNRSVTYAFQLLFFDDDTVTYTVAENIGTGKRRITVNIKNNNESGYFPTPQYWQACGKDFYAGQIADLLQTHWWISLDANVGDTWQRNINNVTASYRLFSKTETVTVPAGTFTNCLKFSYNQAGTFNTDTIYFHPTVSIVKYDGFLIEYQLISKNF